MNVRELINELEQFEDTRPVMVAFQPSYPLAGAVENVADGLDMEDDQSSDTVWIAAGDGYDYAPQGAWF